MPLVSGLMIQTKEKITQLVKALCNNLYEREEAVKLALLAAVAGESVFLLGPPGVGKSLIARRLTKAFSQGKTFEYLMTKFSTPDEVFGPISIKQLKENDTYLRLTDNYMPGATIVFLDEIWKSSSSIQNALLTIINERVYRNGEQEVQVDIKGIITASNELPPNNQSFGPLWDRLLVRYQMSNVKSAQNFLKLITDTGDVYENPIPKNLQISVDELSGWASEINAVEVPAEVLSTLQIIKQKIEQLNQKQFTENPMEVNDRRWKKIVRLMRTSAYLNDRTKVDLMDCFLMVHCLWSEPNQIEALQNLIAEVIRNHGYSVALKLNMIKTELDAYEQEVREEVFVPHTIEENIPKPYNDTYYKLIQPSAQFEGEFIKINDFKKISTEHADVVNFYDAEFKLVNRLKTTKSASQFHVSVTHNSQNYTLKLETILKEKTQNIFKPPHKLVAEFWEQKSSYLRDFIQQQQTLLNQNKPGELNTLANNLFIDESLEKIVLANYNEAKNTLNQCELWLEKIEHLYR